MSDTQGKFYKKLYGKVGEKKAEKYLKKLGYKLIKRNYVTPMGETDLLMQDGETTVFIEVKSRKTDDFGVPSLAVDYKKQQKYVKMALYYMQSVGKELYIRFDIIEITDGEINHIKNAFTQTTKVKK